MYSASVLDNATQCCRLDAHDIGPLKKTTNPVVDFRSSVIMSLTIAEFDSEMRRVLQVTNDSFDRDLVRYKITLDSLD